MKNDMIEKSNLFQYTFYDEEHRLNVVLNEDYITSNNINRDNILMKII